MHVAGEIPVRFRIRLAAEHPDGRLEAREVLPIELDRVDARDESERLMRDEVAVQEAADVRRFAPSRILVIVGDERAERRGVSFFRGQFSRIDQGSDLVLGRPGRSAAGDGEARCERDASRAQDKPPIAVRRR